MSLVTPEPNSPALSAPFPAIPFVDTPGQTDVILRASDGVDFYVHRTILSLMSGVFETMFGLPQAEECPPTPAVVDVQEESAVLDRALRFFYPGTSGTVESLGELREIIEILISKYDMQCLVPSAQRHLERYVAIAPVSVYVVAFIHRWDAIARAAAKETLKLPLRALDTEPSEGLDHIPAAAYHNLLRYHYRCGAAAQRTTRDLSWVSWPDAPSKYYWFECGSCAAQSDSSQRLAGNRVCVPRLWFMEYFIGMGQLVEATPAMEIRNLDHELFTKAVKKANQCGQCRQDVTMHLSHFTGLWKARITEVIHNVEWRF
ncbi:hypothetical protein B0H14DRAFT_2754775 [Mycena olivaceomarginata]|nr:hypothetical protein B0H14DRAFT_2754775 [Mycena olivaceomarginata]